ncbi:MAG: hypothetical protein ACP5N1_05015 [Candidatus Woesearchaeota archaeon]
MTQSYPLDKILALGIMQKDDWYNSLVKITNNGTITKEHIKKINDVAIEVARDVRSKPLSFQRRILQSLFDSWKNIADTSNMPMLNSQEKDIFGKIYFDIANIIPKAHLTTNVMPIFVSAVQENMWKKNDYTSASQKLSEYLMQVNVPDSTIDSILNHNPIKLLLEPTPSHNKGIHLLNKDNQSIFLKIYSSNSTASASELAHLESTANFYLSQIPEIKNRIVGTPSTLVETIDDLAIGIQFNISSKQISDPGIYYWLDGYALLSSYVSLEVKSITPLVKSESYNFDQIKDTLYYLKDIDKLKSQHVDGTYLIQQGSNVVLTDTKEDNRQNGKELDLERLRLGNLALPLPLLFASYGLKLEDKEAMNHYITYYNTKLKKYGSSINNYSESNILYQKDINNSEKILADLELISYPIILKELAGIESREKTSKTVRQQSYLYHFLGIN